MANDVKFEGKERRIAKIEKCLAEYGLSSLEEARELCLSKGIDVEAIVKGVQPIAFENASWAYTLGVAVALKQGITNAADAAARFVQRYHSVEIKCIFSYRYNYVVSCDISHCKAVFNLHFYISVHII